MLIFTMSGGGYLEKISDLFFSYTNVILVAFLFRMR